ncbi:hypothetical protein B0H10DRAFT_109969 [Mycena sp. CBHHK59/15]|nr:hypothetical protein B0H10DRAFT_408183 [Mycena sp. CBHHK59/15]KAJ6614961.1 hypothetical protein B0H10DRAFT_109969 [Mycena sp. CBHHK59/15]
MDQYFPPSTSSAVEDYLDASIMAAQYLDLAHHCSSGHLDPFTHSYPPSETSASSPEATDTASSSSPQAKILSVNSSPGYRQHDLPEPTDTARPHAGFGRHPSSPNYLDPYTQHVADRYPDSLLLPRPSSFHETPMQQRPAASWNQYPMPSLPFISQTSRVALSHPPSPTTSHMLNAFEHYPVSDDLRRWPQMFKITQVKKIGAKKQTMACLFCRERKIGCTRPAEDNLDQTCNQCARRKRRCEYPTESRRGQHTRNRLNSKKFLGLDDTLTLAPPTLPTSI